MKLPCCLQEERDEFLVIKIADAPPQEDAGVLLFPRVPLHGCLVHLLDLRNGLLERLQLLDGFRALVEAVDCLEVVLKKVLRRLPIASSDLESSL